MVYIYRRYDTDRTDRNGKKMIAGGALAAAGLFFGAFSFYIDAGQFSMSASISGYSLIKLASAAKGADASAAFLTYFPAVTSILGAIAMTVSLMGLKSGRANNPSGLVFAASAAGVLFTAAFFAVFAAGATDSTSLSLFGSLMGGSMKMLPGLGTVMQIGGSVLAAAAARKEMIGRN